MNLASAFAASAQKQSQKVALFWGDREYSYAELRQLSITNSERLKALGVQPGARVAIWLKNCPEFIPAIFGIWECGAVVVPINNFLKTDEVSYILKDAEIDLLITDKELAAHQDALRKARPNLRLLLADESRERTYVSPVPPHPGPLPWGEEESDSDLPRTQHVNCPSTDQSGLPLPKGEGWGEGERRVRKQIVSAFEETSDSSSLAVIIYTSGTTGRPKGAMLSHANLLHNVESCRIVLQTVPGDRFAVMLPMFHSYMLTVGILLPLLVGGSIVLVKSLHPVRNALQEIVSRETTILPAIPQFYRSLVAAPGPISLPVRLCISGAAPLPAQILHDFEAKFHVPLIEGYGLSEASPVVTKNPLDGTRKPGSIGLPIPNVEVSIQDDSGNLLGPHQIGELCVRGGNVMLGYWNQPAETAKVLRDGWLLTGDIGYRDTQGYYFITDRKKDMLLVNGINVYPREIEEILYQFPGIKEAAVVGKPDPRKGEQPIAFVSPSDGVVLEEKKLQQFVRGKLADYKVPKKFVLLPALPRNATGKVLKTELRQMA